MEIHAVRRSSDRPRTTRPGVVTLHTFSFGAHYDPGFTGSGPLVALNEERMEPGAGYDEHRHAGLDVVSWVVAGEVAHVDARTGRRLVPAGSVAVLRSGSGIAHEERSPQVAGVPTVLLQSWLVTARAGAPSYAVAGAAGLLGGGRGFARVAAGPGRGPAPTALSVAGAALWVARLAPAESAALPPVPAGWLHVAAGRVALDLPGQAERLGLSAGDGVGLGRGGSGGGGSGGGAVAGAPPDGEAADLPREGGRSPGVVVGGSGPAEVLVWELPETQ